MTDGDDQEGLRSAQPLAQFFDRAALVVLGEPGMGKTTAFEAAAAAEPSAAHVTVRQFLRTPIERWRGHTLYLDALDETRARTADSTSVIDRLAERLGELGRPKFRLSCRAADWESGSDKAAMRDASADGRVTLLRLEPLSDDDVRAIAADRVPDPDVFLRDAEARSLDTLLRNPQTLSLLLDVVGDGGWPATRTGLFEQACSLLLRELNEEHIRAVEDQVPALGIERAAGCLAAVHLLADTEGFALTRAEARVDHPAIHDLDEPLANLRAAARRRMFEAVGPERIAPPHRTISEFMAARYLRDRLREGLPLGRVLALMTGFDGGTLSDLRGVYAWLVALCPEHADQLLVIDPVAAVVYGDASLWTPSTKRLALEHMRRLAEADPYFRANQWSGEPFGGLADAGLVTELEAILTSSRNPHLLSTALDIVRHGTPLPALGAVLPALVRDAAFADVLRSQAIECFARACRDRQDDLLVLLDQIHNQIVPDEQKLLRTTLFHCLYPEVLTPAALVSYLVADDAGDYLDYGVFLSHHLPRLTSDEHLAELAEALANEGAPEGARTQVAWSHLAGAVLRRVLLRPEAADATSLYRWLGMAMTAHGHQALDREHQEIVRRHISDRADLYKGMFRHWLQGVNTERLWVEWDHFTRRLCYPRPPVDFGVWLLGQIEADDGSGSAEALFELACLSLLHWSEPAPNAIVTLFAFVERHPQYAEMLTRRSFCPVADWRLEAAQRRADDAAEQEARRLRNVRALESQLDAVRSGEATGTLVYFAKVWFGLFIELDRDAEPLERLTSETSHEIASALQEGFLALLRRQDLLRAPVEIAQLDLEGRKLTLSEAVLAGLDIVAARSEEEFLALPEPTLACGLCLDLAVPTGHQRTWPGWIRAQRPDLARDALLAFLRPLLAAKVEHPPGIYQLSQSDTFPAAPAVVLSLLQDFPDAELRTLEALLSAALSQCDAEAVERLADGVLSSSGDNLSEAARFRWTAVAFLLAPARYAGALIEITANSADASGQLFVFLKSCWGALAGRYRLDHRLLEPLIAILGTTFSNVEDSRRGRRASDAEPEDVARFIRQLIDRLSGEATRPASEALQRLQADPRLSSWRDYLRHAVAVQLRNRREASFRYADVSQVVATLANRAPANAADLQALAADHLRDLAKDIRDGRRDTWKTFWNTDSHGNATRPRVENECRNRLLDLLTPKLACHDVAADREGSFAEYNRADIAVTAGLVSLPVEIKRHYHHGLWTAPQSQLRDLYARDPATGGRGIYLVLWFGEDEGRTIPTPPTGIARPRNAAELRERLVGILPAEDRRMIEVVVIDCARPRS